MLALTMEAWAAEILTPPHLRLSEAAPVAGLLLQPLGYPRLHAPFAALRLHGLAVLSCLINMTPGTVWVGILPERYELALHVFDLRAKQAGSGASVGAVYQIAAEEAPAKE